MGQAPLEPIRPVVGGGGRGLVCGCQLSHEDRDHVIELIHELGDDLGTTIVVVTHQPEVAATFPRTVTMKGGRVGAEGRQGAEYVVIGAEGMVHLPSHLAAEWPAGTLVRIEEEGPDRLVVSRPQETAETAETAEPAAATDGTATTEAREDSAG